MLEQKDELQFVKCLAKIMNVFMITSLPFIPFSFSYLI